MSANHDQDSLAHHTSALVYLAQLLRTRLWCLTTRLNSPKLPRPASLKVEQLFLILNGIVNCRNQQHWLTVEATKRGN